MFLRLLSFSFVLFSLQAHAMSFCELLLEEASTSGRVEVARDLVEVKKVDLNECYDNQLMNALHRAANNANVKLVQYFISQNISLENKTAWGATALIMAAENSYIGAIKISSLLLEAGANPNSQDNKGTTPLMAALIRTATAASPNAQSDHFQIVKLLIEKFGANVNVQEFDDSVFRKKPLYGNTALIYAARNTSNSFAVAYLLNHGANVNIKNAEGKTALMSAVEARDIKSVKLILENSSLQVIDEQDKNKTSALMIATRIGDSYIELAKNLLSYGADRNLLNNEGLNALAIAKKFKSEGSSFHNQLISILSY